MSKKDKQDLAGYDYCDDGHYPIYWKPSCGHFLCPVCETLMELNQLKEML